MRKLNEIAIPIMVTILSGRGYNRWYVCGPTAFVRHSSTCGPPMPLRIIIILWVWSEASTHDACCCRLDAELGRHLLRARGEAVVVVVVGTV